MRIILIYPKFAEALWAYQSALGYIGKKASSPPLGLLTVAAMLPESWELQLVDLNVRNLRDDEIASADLAFLSAMVAQIASTNVVLHRCRELGVPVVAGGPLFSFPTDNIKVESPDHILAGEVEELMPVFLSDLERGQLKSFYQAEVAPDVRQTPVPKWDLIEDKSPYTMMNIQFTRGCPYDCEFCDVVALNGHIPRMKTIGQIEAELDALYHFGWKGHVFVCDDNFIGNRRKMREEVLPFLIGWMQSHAYPFVLTAAVSIDLADEPEVMALMLEAGFDRVTIGIESPHRASLQGIGKKQNIRYDLLPSVHAIQENGLEVQAGFIVGFDQDPEDIFEEQLAFIQESGIATVMISILFAFPGSRLSERLKSEGRLLPIRIQNHAYGVVNFLPKMPVEVLKKGHLELLESAYSPDLYASRLINFLRHYKKPALSGALVQPGQLKLLGRIIWDMGIMDPGRKYFWKVLWVGISQNIQAVPVLVRLLVTGFHFRNDILRYRQAAT